MRRRRYLSLAGLAAVGLAGCSGDSEGSGDGSDGEDTESNGDATTGTAAPTATTTETATPTETETATAAPTTAAGADLPPAEVVETFLTAAGDGEVERANALVHSDSPEGELEEDNQPEDIVVESTEVLSQDDGVAIVRTEVTIVSEDGDRTYTIEYELRTENGAWRMWDAADGGGGSEVRAPQVAWEFESVPSDDVVVVTHNGGDGVDAATVVAKNLEGTTFGTLEEFFDGTEIVAGDEGRIDVPADTRGTIQLVWRNPDTDASRVIGEGDYDVR